MRIFLVFTAALQSEPPLRTCKTSEAAGGRRYWSCSCSEDTHLTLLSLHGGASVSACVTSCFEARHLRLPDP